MSDLPEVRDNAGERRYEIRVGDTLAFLQYHDKAAGVRSLVHTEVPPALAGKGLGGRLVAAALEDARKRGLRVIPVCPFVAAYLSRHPHDADLIDRG